MPTRKRIRYAFRDVKGCMSMEEARERLLVKILADGHSPIYMRRFKSNSNAGPGVVWSADVYPKRGDHSA